MKSKGSNGKGTGGKSEKVTTTIRASLENLAKAMMMTMLRVSPAAKAQS